MGKREGEERGGVDTHTGRLKRKEREERREKKRMGGIREKDRQ